MNDQVTSHAVTDPLREVDGGYGAAPRTLTDFRRWTIFVTLMGPVALSERPTSIARVGQEAGTLIGAALAANAVTLLLSELVAPVPFVTAMLTTLAFAGVWLGLSEHFSAGTSSLRFGLRVHLYAAGLTMLGVFLGTWLLVAAVGDGRTFYCEPAVPWRIEIAMFGSFAVGFSTRMADARGRARLIYPLTLIALLWIAPFYGFFSAPIFLATELAAGCADRGFVFVILAALGMILGQLLGNVVGAWLSSPRRGSDVRR
jgi:MFS family permease